MKRFNEWLVAENQTTANWLLKMFASRQPINPQQLTQSLSQILHSLDYSDPQTPDHHMLMGAVEDLIPYLQKNPQTAKSNELAMLQAHLQSV